MRRTLIAFAALLLSSPLARAQSPIDPSGHWDGSLQLPAMDVGFQIDFAKNANGELAGTISIPTQHLNGLPLTKIAVDGSTITFGARSDQLMEGTISSDGKSIAGDFSMNGMNGMRAPFTLTRTGDAKVPPLPRGASLRKEFEGRWQGTLDVDGGLHLVLTLANEGGASVATIVNIDEGGLTIPLLVAMDGSTIRLTSTATEGVFAATLNKDATELTGTYTQGAVTLPLTFTRAR
jgi:hypothetical protein